MMVKAVRVMLITGAAALLAAGVVFAAPRLKAQCARAGNRLQLSDEQKAKIEPIREKYRAEFRKLHEAMQAEIAPLLTPEQRQQISQRGPSMNPADQWFRGPARGRMGMMHARGARMGRLADRLQLTTGQRDKIRTILSSHRDEIRALREKAHAAGADRTQVRADAKALRTKVMDEIRTVLTPDQQNKLQAMREQIQQRRNG